VQFPAPERGARWLDALRVPRRRHPWTPLFPADHTVSQSLALGLQLAPARFLSPQLPIWRCLGVARKRYLQGRPLADGTGLWA
jgi:hypothetical protein